RVEYPDPLPANISIGGTVEQLGSRADVIVAALCTMLNDLDTKRQLRQFFACAKAGKPFTFARYSDDVVLTTTSAIAAAGDMTISLTSTAGVVVGQQYVLRDEFDCEILKIASVGATSVTLYS